MNTDLIILKEYYTEATRQVPSDSHYMQSLNHKFRHSLEVLRQGQNILQQTPELRDKDETFRDLSQKALLLHDVGRFEETVQRYKAKQNGIKVTALSDKFNHGIIGYELLQNKPPYDDMRILFAIRWHGRMMEEVQTSAMYQQIKDSPQFAEIMQILYLVRDADKLANLYVIKAHDHLRQDPFYISLSADILNAPLSEAVKAQFFAKKVILSATLSSFADRILQVISWIYDFNYRTTVDVFKQQQYDKFLLDMLAQYHHDPRDLQQIKAEVAARF